MKRFSHFLAYNLGLFQPFARPMRYAALSPLRFLSCFFSSPLPAHFHISSYAHVDWIILSSVLWLQISLLYLFCSANSSSTILPVCRFFSISPVQQLHSASSSSSLNLLYLPSSSFFPTVSFPWLTLCLRLAGKIYFPSYFLSVRFLVGLLLERIHLVEWLDECVLEWWVFCSTNCGSPGDPFIFLFAW